MECTLLIPLPVLLTKLPSPVVAREMILECPLTWTFVFPHTVRFLPLELSPGLCPGYHYSGDWLDRRSSKCTDDILATIHFARTSWSHLGHRRSSRKASHTAAISSFIYT